MLFLALTACSFLFPPSDASGPEDSGSSWLEDELDTCLTEGCGGDPTGEWVIRDVCAPETPTNLEGEECSGATFTWREFDMEGRFAFADDGTYALDFGEGAFVADLHWPVGCDAVEGDEEGCMEAEDEDMACTWSARGCDCRWTWSDARVGTQDGEWSTYGDDLYLDEGDGLAYCLDGDGLFFDITFSGLPPVRLKLTPR